MLTRPTVSAVVRDLIDDAVVEELGLCTAGGVGKPATLVGIDADGRHILCLDLSAPSRFIGAIVNLTGKVVVRRTYERKGETGRAAVTLDRRICRGSPVADADRPLLGIGIARIFAFILSWNEFIFALVIMNKPETQRMPVWLRAFNEGARGRTGVE